MNRKEQLAKEEVSAALAVTDISEAVGKAERAEGLTHREAVALMASEEAFCELAKEIRSHFRSDALCLTAEVDAESKTPAEIDSTAVALMNEGHRRLVLDVSEPSAVSPDTIKKIFSGGNQKAFFESVSVRFNELPDDLDAERFSAELRALADAGASAFVIPSGAEDIPWSIPSEAAGKGEKAAPVGIILSARFTENYLTELCALILSAEHIGGQDGAELVGVALERGEIPEDVFVRLSAAVRIALPAAGLAVSYSLRDAEASEPAEYDADAAESAESADGAGTPAETGAENGAEAVTPAETGAEAAASAETGANTAESADPGADAECPIGAVKPAVTNARASVKTEPGADVVSSADVVAHAEKAADAAQEHGNPEREIIIKLRETADELILDGERLENAVMTLAKDKIVAGLNGGNNSGRGGRSFTELSASGELAEMNRFNALVTLKEYAADHGSQDTRIAVTDLVLGELYKIEQKDLRDALVATLKKVRSGERGIRL